jgi:hypothetical protein
MNLTDKQMGYVFGRKWFEGFPLECKCKLSKWALDWLLRQPVNRNEVAEFRNELADALLEDWPRELTNEDLDMGYASGFLEACLVFHLMHFQISPSFYDVSRN